MITWLIGDNSFEVSEALAAIIQNSSALPERFDGTTLTLADLPNILMGVSLFSVKRLVIISNLTENSAIWEKLPSWIERISDDIDLVFIDEKPDKRRLSYKALQAVATVREFSSWTDKDQFNASSWLEARAKTMGIELSKKDVQTLLRRVGLNQWQLAHALDTLALADKVDTETIEAVIPANPSENALLLFETALKGDVTRLSQAIEVLKNTEVPQQIFSLLTTQLLSFAAVSFAKGPGQSPAADIGIHPYVVKILTPHAQKRGAAETSKMLADFARADQLLKGTATDPWVLIERLLMGIALKK